MTPPLIVRVAGLPAEVMDAFSHGTLLRTLQEGDRIRERLGQARAALVDCLHAAVRTDDRDGRRFLLSVKRSCFNGGDLKVFQRDPRWPLLADAAGALVEEALILEGAVEEAEALFAELYRRALRRERESLAALLENRAFVRGVALASPDLARNLDRLRGCEPESFGRRENRLCLALLRYASRAALKLSPFSTLTRTGLAATGGAPEGFAFQPGAAWRERSTVSLRRELLEQCSCLLLRCEGFSRELPVELNETLIFEADGICAFFRPGRWELDDESRAFRHRDPSSVRARLEGPLVPWLIAELRGSPRTYRELIDRARATFDDEDSAPAEEGIAGLLDIGFLNLVLPWSFSGPDLERKMLEHLEILPGGAGVGAFRDRLRDLAGLLGGYAETGCPARLLEQARRGVEGLFQALAAPAEVDPRIEFRAGEKTFEEDVFLLPEHEGTREIVHLSRERMEGLLEDLEPLAGWLDLHNGAHDLLRTLAAFGQRRWGLGDVGLLECFGAAQPLFNEYLRYRAGLLVRPVPPPGFNPLDLESVRSLQCWRERAGSGLDACFEDAGGEQRLCPRALGDLLAESPVTDARALDFCAFVQPLDPAGGLWALGSLNEGYGRLGSRFTSGMDESTRARWTASYTPLSFLELEGEPAELIDMACPGNRTINVHIRQTRRMLKMPGDHSAFAPERVIGLRGLRVRFRGADRAPVLTDVAGRRLLPVPLGSLSMGGRPTLLKFLAMFGPRDPRGPLPLRAARARDGIEVTDRHRLGRIVYARKKWKIETGPALSGCEERGGAAAYAAVNRWRLGKGIPGRVYAQEPIALKASLYRRKPQYIDFSSPTFLQVFRSVLKSGARFLTLEEALPEPERFPVHENRWAAEIQLESFALRREFMPLVGYERKTACPAGLTRKE